MSSARRTTRGCLGNIRRHSRVADWTAGSFSASPARNSLRRAGCAGRPPTRPAQPAWSENTGTFQAWSVGSRTVTGPGRGSTVDWGPAHRRSTGRSWPGASLDARDRAESPRRQPGPPTAFTVQRVSHQADEQGARYACGPTAKRLSVGGRPDCGQFGCQRARGKAPRCLERMYVGVDRRAPGRHGDEPGRRSARRRHQVDRPTGRRSPSERPGERRRTPLAPWMSLWRFEDRHPGSGRHLAWSSGDLLVGQPLVALTS